MLRYTAICHTTVLMRNRATQHSESMHMICRACSLEPRAQPQATAHAMQPSQRHADPRAMLMHAALLRVVKTSFVVSAGWAPRWSVHRHPSHSTVSGVKGRLGAAVVTAPARRQGMAFGRRASWCSRRRTSPRPACRSSRRARPGRCRCSRCSAAR